MGPGMSIKQMTDGHQIENFTEAVGKKITALELVKEDDSNREQYTDALRFIFEDGTGIEIYDDGRNCCEIRYMTTDDDLSYHVGATLMGATIEDAPETTDKWGEVHEIQFLAITTSKGVFTMQTHNENNGYYGGFWIKINKITKEDDNANSQS